MLWNKIENALESKGLSAYRLARNIDEPYTTIMNIKNGATRNPGFYLIAKIADELGVSLDYFREEQKESGIEEFNIKDD